MPTITRSEWVRVWVHRLVLYPSLVLYRFLMGVFFLWGYAE